MKLNNIIKTIISLIFIFTLVLNASTQIRTNYFSEQDIKKNHTLLAESILKACYNTNHIHINSTVVDKSGLLRYGDVLKADINLRNNGVWINHNTWKLLIVSPKAKTMELVFENVKLTEGASVNVYNVSRNMVFGPMNTRNINHSHSVPTDIMLGDSIIVQLDIPNNTDKEHINFSITKIIHGFKDIISNDTLLKSAGTCEVDVKCSEGSGWETESNGVGRITGNGHTGSCSLLNNTAQDYKAYIFTAKHVIDGIGDLSNASVRFNYKAASCGSSSGLSGITISGISLKASSAAYDLALLESSDDLSSETSVTFLGWQRSTPTTSSVVCIHHPQGGFMKISKDDDSFSILTNHVSVSDWDIGSIEPGSSGSPLFDENKRIIAAAKSINGIDKICTSALVSTHPRLTRFWSDVSSYLDPCNTGATYINSITVNSTLADISGASLVCTGGESYILQHSLGDATFNWEATPPSLFSSPSSGVGTNISVSSSSSSSGGKGKIRFYNDCSSFEKDIWVGVPRISSIDGSQSVPNNQWAYYTAELESSLSAPTDYNWILNPLNGNSVYDYGVDCDIAFYNSGSYQLVVQALNTCSSPNFGPYYVTGLYVYDAYYMMVSPNPASTEATVTIAPVTSEDASLKSASTAMPVDENTEWEYEVYSTMQSLKAKKTKIRGNSTKINTQSWKEGVYTVRAKYKGEVLTGKLVVKK